MIAVFLLAPDHNVAPSSLMEMSQVAVDQWLNSVFRDPSCQKISEHCEDFIRTCLVFEPGRRMKSSEAKSHPWFQQNPDKEKFKYLLAENAKTWKPTHFIAPPVQELPEMENSDHGDDHDDIIPSPTTTIKRSKRRPVETSSATDYSQMSPYFAELRPSTSKRLKTSNLEHEGH